MSEPLQNFRFQLRSPTGGDVTVWQQGYGIDNARWRVLRQYKGWVIERVVGFGPGGHNYFGPGGAT